MNVYDFDNTIYDGDSTAGFYKFCLKRHKKIILLSPCLLCSFVKYYVFKIGSKTQFKESMYKFLRYCDIDKDVKDFWEQNIHNFKDFYLKQKAYDDVIISASPEFLLKPLEKEFGFTIIASVVDKHTGKYTGVNCYYDEKVRRFHELYPSGQIDNFYSDHYSDEPLAKISKKAFIVDGDKIIKWDFNVHHKPRL